MSMSQKKEQTKDPSRVSFPVLAFQALPEIWSFQILAGLILALPAAILMTLIDRTASTAGAVTTADPGAFFLSWRFPVILILGLFLIFLYTVTQILSLIDLSGAILTGEKAGLFREIRDGFVSLGRLFTPMGVLVLFYILIAVPLGGVGFSITLTKSLYVPSFIMDVVLETPLYAGAYFLTILVLVFIGYRAAFTLHGVILDGLTPGEAMRQSVRIVKERGKSFILAILGLQIRLSRAGAAAWLLFSWLPETRLEEIGRTMPIGHTINIMAVEELPEGDIEIVLYRILCALAVMTGQYMMSIVTLLCGSYFMLRFTCLYLEYTGRDVSSFPARSRKGSYARKVLLILLVFLITGAASVVLGLFYNQIFDREEPVRIVAHRAGGTMAPENSLEGLEQAIRHGCYASEIDVQRTKDGAYIINHDNDFRRLTGVARAPEDMTLEEVRALKIRDTTGGGHSLRVPTLEEMLSVIKGRHILYIELKGATADRKMVDDVAAMVREYGCQDQVALISLDYPIISYAETLYPELVTGTLFFAGLGDFSRLNCDLLIMEEESATNSRMDQIHNEGKQAIVWTVNSESSMRRFLDSKADAVITDKILLAEKVQKELDQRTDLQVLIDRLGGSE